MRVRADPLAAETGRAPTEIIDAARRRMLEEGWDLAIVLTDLPLRAGRRPVVADVSATHGVGLVSLPALGPLGLRRRVREAVLRLVEGLVGESLELRLDGDGDGAGDEEDRVARRRRVARRLVELAAPERRVVPDDDDIDVGFVAAVVRGNLRLLAGMVRANRPWRLIARLSRALAAAVAAVVFALVTSDIWRVADALSWPRLTLLTLLSVSAIVAFLIVSHGLWERAARARDREQAILFNFATTTTLTLGVLCLYVALLALALAGAALMVDGDVMAEQIGHRVGLVTYAKLAWLASSLATVAGALGAGLESDAAVREAAYGYRPERQTERDRPGSEEIDG
ncbi:MAG: hypothetical protein JWQ48_2687 [Conexibacter sp.]|nr:hypothetical protein [Conexibacter sp.]